MAALLADALCWRASEARLNALPQFKTGINGKHRSWVEKLYPHVIYFQEASRGGRFAAWEQPQVFSEELRAGFRALR
jgi:hypothetical protein